MKVLVTGHDGYIGCILVPMLADAGHEAVGLDSFLYGDCVFGANGFEVEALAMDVRDVDVSQLAGFDAIMHLAAICNDPIGDLNPQCTYDVNHLASVRLARLAKEAGVPRFLFSSSCSLYGAAGDDLLDESAAFNPVTAYGESKVLVEEEVAQLADDDFSPTFLRNATAYGLSARQRGDIVVNNLVGFACTTGEVRMSSDGTPWRPLVHIGDISSAFLAVLQAPRELVHNEAFNVGHNQENYRIRDVAEIVEQVVPESTIQFASDAGPDLRNYRVAFDKLAKTLPDFEPRWTVRRGVEELFEAFERERLTLEDFTSSRFMRLKRIRELQEQGRIDEDLRWRAEPVAEVGPLPELDS